MERRASRRFSSYQIQKHLQASPNGVPVIPPAQNSPIPNRGQHIRESREMMSAVKARGSYQHSRQKSSSRLAESSPSRTASIRNPQRISEEREDVNQGQKTSSIVIPQPAESAPLDSPTMKTPEDMYKPLESEISPVSGTMNGPPTLPGYQSIYAESKQPPPAPPEHASATEPATEERPNIIERSRGTHTTPPQSQQFNLEDSPPSGKELTLFLQYKSKIKKFVLPEGSEGLTIARLQLAFIEKFAWHTQNNGVDLPDIYVQDPVSGVRHELEDMADVKDRVVLVLNVEALDEVKRHLDNGLGDIRKMLESVRGVVEGQNSMMQRLGDRQLEASKEMARISVTPARSSTHVSTPAQGSSSTTAIPPAASVSEVQTLRRDIAVLRQTYANMSSEFAASLNSIKSKGANVKAIATDAAVPTYEGDAGRVHVNKGKKALSHDSESLVNHVDDLSDMVEDLRKDVVTRGVRPLPRQLESISKDISSTVKELAKMKEFLKREKPIWTKIWEQELNLVCTERDELTQQEDLMADLHGDLEDLTGVFKLVEEATKQQNLQNGTGAGAGAGGLRSTSRNIALDTDVDPHKAKDGVLGEVRALQPNHENRLEAIERAEKLRQKELESRKGGEFQREVATFVEEGKLKKTGGADEVERLRKIKDERNRKAAFELAQQRRADMEAREAEQAAAAAAAPETEEETQSPEADGEAAFEDASEHNRSEAEAPIERDVQEAEDGAKELVDEPADDLIKNGTSFLDA